MMRYGLVAAVLAGCASAGQGLTPDDGPGGGQPDSPSVPIDAAVVRDSATQHDAHVYMDAHVYEDAHVYQDAHVYMDAPPCTPHTTNLLANPVFDLTPQGMSWTQVPIDSAYPPITSDGIAPQSAPYKAWMGGFTGTDKGVSSVTDQLYQDFTVPANTTQLVLTGYYLVGTQETTTTTVYDTGSVDLTQTSGTPIENVMSPTNLTNTGSSWVAFSHTFAANLSGQTVRLRITSTNDITNVTNFFFDTLALNATHCP
jgi:hypothetical protein